jgi:uncharacterized protein
LIKPSGTRENSPSAEAQILILSDGKPGHLNQSIAFAKLLGCRYQVRGVAFRNRLLKLVSYLFDRLGIRFSGLFEYAGDLPPACMVVSTGSETYFANRIIARDISARSVVLMWPAGYRADFDLVVAQQHDNPPLRDNLLVLPVNLSAPVAAGLVSSGPAGVPCIAIIIGGPSKHFRFDLNNLERQLQQVFRLFPNGDFLVTTSRRTPRAVELLLEKLPFRYRLLYSQRQDNPIADFLALADVLFITEDSTSMISEAVCWGRANVEVMPLSVADSRNKIRTMIGRLAKQGYLHLFDGNIGNCNLKFDLKTVLQSEVRRRSLL